MKTLTPRKETKFKLVINLAILLALAMFASAVQAANFMPPDLVEQLQAQYPDGLPAYMTPEEQQWLDQQAIQPLFVQPPSGSAPPTGAVWAPGEYEPSSGILIRWNSTYSSLQSTFVAHASKPDVNGTVSTVYCFVNSTSEQTAATTAFTSAGANMSNVQFFVRTTDAMWITDYGPRYVYMNNNHTIIDHVYNRAGRPNDDTVPAYLAATWGDPCYNTGLWHGGGNFIVHSDGNAFTSTLIREENTGYSYDDINDIFKSYYNVNLTVYPRLIPNVDGTGHIDMWLMALPGNKFIVSQFATDHPISRASTDAAVADLTARGYTVSRTPARNTTGEGTSGGTHYTYTNATILNKRVFVPIYGGSEATNDTTALNTWRSALPADYNVIGINCSSIITLSGAIHCITKNVFNTTTPIPTIEVNWPNGGEMLTAGSSQTIQYAASDDVAVTSVNLYYSTNAGSTWNTIATGLSNTGAYSWTVPATVSTQYRIKAVAYDANSNTRQDISDKNFTVSTTDPNVGIAGNWVLGLNHPRDPGNNRELILIAYAERTTVGAYALNTVTYGGQSMTKIVDYNVGATTSTVCTSAFRLNESGIAAATSGTFVPTWSATPTNVKYISVFLSDVNQTTPIGATGRNGTTTGATITTSALATQTGDLVLDAATCSTTGSYTLGSSFTEVNELDISGADAVVGTKKATGASETPSATHSTTTERQTLIGFVVKHAAASGAPPATRTLTVSTSSGGTVTTPGIGNFNYSDGTNASIVAANDVNYRFVNWTGTAVTAGKVANANAASTTVLMDANYTVTANFAVNTRSLTTSTTAGGTVSTPGIGTYWYNQGTNNSIVAANDVNYRFVNWTGSAVTAGKVANANAASTTVLMDANYTVTANFAVNTRSLTTSTSAGGSVATPGIGTYWYNQGTTNPIVASANTGYHFVNWTGTAVTAGKVANATAASTTVLVDANYTVQSNFTINQYSITGTAGANGSISPSGTFSKDYGSSQLFTATPIGSHDVDTWYLDGSPVQTGGTTYTLSGITADHTVNVTFKIKTFSITGTAGANGSISPSGTFSKDYGSSQLFTATPVGSHDIDTWYLDGSPVQTGGLTYTLTNITATHTVNVTFKIKTFTLTYTAGANGSIVGTTPQTVDYGTSGTAVTAQPALGYHFVSWSDSSTENPRTDLNVTANISVTATFTQDEYTLTINTVGNGSVAKSPDQATYHYGDVVTLNPTADAGWTFSAFSGDTTTNTITMNGNKTVTATFTQDEYTLTINTVGNGSVAKSPDQATYHYGDVVTLNPTADAGWTFSAFSGDTTTNTITMNGNKTVTATFTQDEYTLTINTVGNGSVAKSPDQATYHYGDVVTLNPTADAGWTFSAFSGDTTTNTITMNGNKTVTATFTQDEYTLTINTVGNGSVAKSPDQATYHYGDVVTLNPTADAGWTFSAFSGDTTTNTITMNGNKTVTATFTQDEYTLTINTVGNGSVAKSPDQATYHYGDVVTLNPTADAGWTFSAFSGDTTTNTITMNGNKTVTATFTQDEYTLTINTVGNGSVAKSPDQATYHYGDVVTLNPTADAGWTFSAFSGDTTTNTITMNGNKTVTATFTQDEYTLTINTVGNGSVAKSPDQATYHYGDVVTLNPTADAGWTFSAFSGDTTTNTITMNGNKTVTATFTQDEYTLTINTVGNGSVAKSPDQATYHYGDVVTLNPTADAGWTFSAFSGDTTTNTITMNGNKTVTATFTQDEYTLTINTVGNGSVAKSPDQATYHYGDVVTLNPTADAGWTFSAFSGDTTTNTITMNGNKTVTATFTQDEYTLTINTVGNGSVAKSPDQATYHYGDVVTLNPTADAGWTFSAFSGDTTTNTITMNGNKTVTATFTQDEYTLTINTVGNGSVAKSPDQATYHYGDVVTLNPTADAGWTFSAFSGDTTTNTITMNGNKTVTATFTQDEYTLTINTVGNGSVAKSPDQATYHYGDVVTLNPTADAGWTFSAFSGDTTTNTITMNGNKTVTATFTQDEYTLTINTVGNGSVAKSPDQATYHYGDVVTLNPTADAGWTFSAFSGDTTTNTITMNGNKTVTATFTQDEYTLTINTVGNGSVAKSPDQATYHYGDVVTLNPTADAGWTFSAFSGDTTTNTITMNGNKTVTATFTQDEYTLTINTVGNGSVAKSPDQATYHYGDVVTLNPTADAGWTFSAFSGDTTTNTITMNGNKTVTATFTQDEYTLTINTVGNGSVAKSPDQATYHYGDVVTLNPTADAGWTFSAFSGDTTTNTITMNGNKTVTATFTQDEYTLTINTVGNGSVAKSPDQATYHYGDVVTLNPTADAGWTFSAFSGDTTTNTITMNGNKTVTATFTQDEYTLTINTVGNGSVAKSPDQATYHYGDVVTLNPTADAGWTFSAFSGDTTTNTITMNGNKTVTATFTQDEYTLTINTVGNGSVAKSPDQATYHYGDVVTLNPTADAGWTFSAFSGDTTTNTITMNGNKTVTATFTQDEYTLTINTVGNGSVAKSPDQATYHYGDVVTLNPTADAGWTFSAFSGDTTTNTITMNGNKTVTATFTQDEYTLTINTVGNGSVAKSPDQATYHYGDVVTLNPTADAGWTFSAFSGDTTTNTITMNGNKTVTATFTQDEYTLTINTVGNGSVAKSPDQATYHYGDVVTLNPTADAGWTFSAFSGDTTTNTITMNGNKTVTATFTQDEYTLTINTVGNGSVAKSPDQATYHYGDVVTLNPTADAGWTFSAFSGDTTTNTITMNGNKTVTATFTQDEYTLTINTVGNGSVAKSPDQATYHYGDVVTLNPTADAGWTFSAFSGDTTTNTITMNGNKTVTATFTQDEYTLTINTVGNGSVAKSPDQATYHYGDVVTLNPTADAGWTFSAFSGDTTTNTITMNGNKTVTATFTQDEYTLTINTVGNGSVAKSPDQATYHYGDVVTLNPTADAGWTFSAFSGDTTTNTITMNGNKTVTATFTQDEYTLTINTVGNGSVAKSPDQATYHYGDVVTLNPTADAGWTFSAFSGDTTTNTITMNGNKTVTATFTQDEYTLTINTVGNGSVAKSPDQATYHYGDVVTLNPTADAGWTFSAFSGDTTTNTITMNGNKTVTATFTQDEYTLTINTVGNGSVAKSPDQATYHYGDVVTLNPTADAGWTFSAFSGDTTTNTITMNGNKTVTATFTIDTFTLEYTAGANGSISGTTPQTVDYGTSGTAVTAQPATGYHFVKWSDDSNQNPRTDVNVTANISVTASFAIDTFTLTYTADANGDITGTTPQTVDYGANGTAVTAAPHTGYHFVKWSDDSTQNPRTDVNVTANISVTASFAIDTFTLTYTAGENGSISGTTPQTVDYGASGTAVTAQPALGYHFVKWSDDSTANPRTDLNVTANIAVTASFAIDTFTVTASAGANGSIDPTGDITKDYGSSQLFTAMPTTGYEVDKWMVDGNEAQVGGTTYTLSSITSAHTVAVSFKISTCTVTASAGANGSIDPTGAVDVNYGDDQVFTAIPDAGYEVTEWFVDGESVQTGGTTYTLTGVTAAHTVHVQFTGLQYEISGTITCAGLPVANVTMGGLGVITDVNGFYYTTVAYGWSGVVTPSKDGYTFDPNSMTYTSVVADQIGQNYRALPSDNFNDNRRGSMWRQSADSSSVWHSEQDARLNIGSAGWANLALSCTGHWKMNDNAASTTVLDASGNGKNGTAMRNTSILHTAGKIDGALTFNGTDSVDIGNVIGTGAYTKVAWVKRDASGYYNNILSSGDVASHVFWAPSIHSFKISSGHVSPFNAVQDTVPLDVNVWYYIAVTFDPAVNSGRMVLYKNGVKVSEANSVPTQAASTKSYIGRYATGYNWVGAIDNVMIFNRAITSQEIAALYNAGNGTEDINASSKQASYSANGWKLDTIEDLAVKVDYRYSGISTSEGWIGLSVGDDANYVSISCGSDGGQSYFYYQAVVDGSVVSEREARTSNDGTLYVSYNAATKDFYLSHGGFGSENAYVWHTPNATRGLWSMPVDVSLGGGSAGAALGAGEAYMDNFEMAKAGLLGWPVVTDIDNNGFIEIYDLAIMCENWLDSGEGDIDNNGIVDFRDFAEFGLAW